jgi:hypothetical protein
MLPFRSCGTDKDKQALEADNCGSAYLIPLLKPARMKFPAGAAEIDGGEWAISLYTLHSEVSSD